MRPRLLALALALACGHEAPSAPAPRDEARGAASATGTTDDEGAEAHATETVETAEPAPAQAEEDIGWAALPPPPASAAREALEAASRARTAGDLQAAAAHLDRALRAAPDFLEAHFERARLASRAGDLASAARTIELLWRRDLPTYGPRYDAEDDLAGLRRSPEGQALTGRRAAIEAGYEAAMRGHSVVWRQTLLDPGGGLRVQPGGWTRERFVPMAPSVTVATDADHPEAAPFATAYFDPERRRSAILTGIRDPATGALTHVELRAFESPTGRLIGEERLPPREDGPTVQVRARFTEGGLMWESHGRRGRLGPPGRLQGATLEAGKDVVVPRSVPGGLVVEDDRRVRVGTPDEPTFIELPAAHQRGEATQRLTDTLALEDGRFLVVTVVADARAPAPYAVTRLEQEGGAELLLAGEAAHVAWRQGQGEALVEIDDRLFRIGAEGDPQPLPAGLGL